MRVGQYKPNLRIAELRKDRGMTQAELAEKAQLGPSGRGQVAKFEGGFRIPTWDTLAELALAGQDPSVDARPKLAERAVRQLIQGFRGVTLRP